MNTRNHSLENRWLSSQRGRCWVFAIGIACADGLKDARRGGGFGLGSKRDCRCLDIWRTQGVIQGVRC